MNTTIDEWCVMVEKRKYIKLKDWVRQNISDLITDYDFDMDESFFILYGLADGDGTHRIPYGTFMSIYHIPQEDL